MVIYDYLDRLTAVHGHWSAYVSGHRLRRSVGRCEILSSKL